MPRSERAPGPNAVTSVTRLAATPGAVAHLSAADPILASVIDRVGELEIALEPDLWWALVESIVSQQLSIRAAETILARVAALAAPATRPTARQLIATADEELRNRGLSRAKAIYVKDLAAHWLDGSIDADALRLLPDEEVIEALTRVKGIGRWTAEMALIFSLGRPDVLPVDDLGFRAAVQRAYALDGRPPAEALRRLAEPWRPYRTLGTLYLWRSLKIG